MERRKQLLCIALVCAAACRGPAAEQAAQPAAGIAYEVELNVRDGRELRRALKAAARTAGDPAILPASLEILRRRTEEDVPRLRDTLQRFGYFGGSIEVTIETNAAPVRAVFEIAPGPLYLFGDITVDVTNAPPEAAPAPPDTRLEPGQPAATTEILAQEKELLAALRDKGYPFAALADRRVVVDHGSRRVELAYTLSSGPQARFGPVGIEGVRDVEPAMIRRELPWRSGETYRESQVETLRRRLLESGLFSTVSVTSAPEPAADGLLPITVRVAERKPRTIRAGAGYWSDVGLGGNLGFEHRNLAGLGQRLTVSVHGSQAEVGAEAQFERPYFYDRRNSLLIGAELLREDTDAYVSRAYEASVGVATRFSPRLRTSAGLSYRISEVDQWDDSENTALLRFPLLAEWDGSDDLLDPARGQRVSARCVPFTDPFTRDADFLKLLVDLAHYSTLAETPRLVLAGRLAAGSILGSGRSAIPADLRFYAGGGGSIRGYDYQSVGQQENGVPLGGKSLIEVSAELRAQVWRDFGAVVFVDGGTVFADSMPGGSDSLAWGCGLGLRYHTPVGPFRFDVAMPLDDAGNDAPPYALYISLGQAF